MHYPSYLFAYNDEKPTYSLVAEFIEQHIQSVQNIFSQMDTL